MKGLVSSLSLLVAGAAAQQSAYGQCGGSSWSGSTSCTAGYACTTYNAFYAQCVPGTASATATSSSVKTTSTGASSVDSPHLLELRAGPGALGQEQEQQHEKKRSCGGDDVDDGQVVSSQTPVVTLSSSSTTKVTTTTSSSKVASTTTTSKVSSSVASTTKSSASATSTSTGLYAKTDGTMFNIDGVTQYYAGTNCYWCGFLTNDNDTDTVFSHMATAGFKIIRVWGFNDVTSIPSSGTVYYQYLSASGSTINTGADGLERLDVVVAAAEKYGLKLIINFVNNWSDYGGIAAYVTAFGGSATSWYTDSASQAQYQKYIQAVVSRYSTSTAIFSWELANEPRCSGCDTYVLFGRRDRGTYERING